MIERLLIVGLGSIGKRHATIARRLLPTTEIAALRHRSCDEDRVSGVDRCFTGLGEAVAYLPDAAVIANPSTLHLTVAQSLADAGVHLLVEKPISSSCDGVDRLIATCAAQGLVLMTGYNLRFLPSLLAFRDALQSGRIGPVFSVRAEIGQYLPNWRPASDYRKSVTANSALGGGVLLELSHEIDYLRWLFGEVDWVSAIELRQSRLEIDVPDTAHLVLGHAGPGGRPVASLSMDLFRHDTMRTCTAIGEDGSLRWNAVSGAVDLYRCGADSWESIFSQPPIRDDSYLAEWHHFIECLAGRQTPRVSGEDGLAALRIIDAAHRSSVSGSVIRIAHGGTADSRVYVQS